MSNDKKMKIAFVVGKFPAISETFIIDQVVGLLERDIEVEIFSFNKGSTENISEKFYKHDLMSKTHYLEMPGNKFVRILSSLPKLIKVIWTPSVAREVFNLKKYGNEASSLKLLYWVEPFMGKRFDLTHCHFGPIANKYLKIQDILHMTQPIITTFYGYDVSNIVKQKGFRVYDRLKKEGSLFFVMSNNMKERVLALGFEPEKVMVQPVGITSSEYEFMERSVHDREMVNIVSVGRFVEKKGFDDLLRALSIVKQKAKREFKCTIVGGGPLGNILQEMTDNLKIREVVDYRGYMKIEEIIKLFGGMHFFVQPSKTATNGDME